VSDLLLDREVILLGGTQSSGKSYSIAKLVEEGQDEDNPFSVMVIDRDRGLGKALKEVFGKGVTLDKLENLDYRLITTWEGILEAIEDAFKVLGAGDWLVFEHCGKLWEFAQEEFSRHVYGEDVGQHLEVLRAEAQQIIDDLGIDLRSSVKGERSEAHKAVSTKVAFNGLEGRYDWGIIKRQHNGSVFDRAIVEGSFNVLTTTSMTPLQDDDIKQNRWPDFHKIGMRPEGEKHQVYRHDTVSIVYQKDGTYLWRTNLGSGSGPGKDRGRALHRDIDFKNKGFVRSYLDTVED